MLMNRIRRLFYGRHGFDQLSAALMVAGILFVILAGAFTAPWLYIPYFLCIGLCVYRAFSKNSYKRWQENTRYMNLRRRGASACQLRIRMLRECRTHRYLRCPNCRQRLRVPRGKGKINITCAKCNMRFIKKV